MSYALPLTSLGILYPALLGLGLALTAAGAAITAAARNRRNRDRR